MRILFSAALAVLAGPAAAQSGWSFAVSPYVWVPGINTSLDTDFGALDASRSNRAALEDLDLAFMGAFEARRGRWGLIGDLIYAKLSNEEDTPFGALFDSAEVTTKLGALTGYGYWRAYEDAHLSLDLLGGVRYYDLKVEVDLTEGLLRPRELESKSDWWDGVVGFRGRGDFNENIFSTVLVDVGGFDTGSDFTWQALATVGYQFDDRWSAQAGWRYLDVEKEIWGEDVQVELDGPILGFTYRF
jgi:hypothetical protein